MDPHGSHQNIAYKSLMLMEGRYCAKVDFSILTRLEVDGFLVSLGSEIRKQRRSFLGCCSLIRGYISIRCSGRAPKTSGTKAWRLWKAADILKLNIYIDGRLIVSL